MSTNYSTEMSLIQHFTVSCFMKPGKVNIHRYIHQTYTTGGVAFALNSVDLEKKVHTVTSNLKQNLGVRNLRSPGSGSLLNSKPSTRDFHCFLRVPIKHTCMNQHTRNHLFSMGQP